MDKIKVQRRKWYMTRMQKEESIIKNREHVKLWRDNNKDKVHINNKKYRHTPRGKYVKYKNRAKGKDTVFLLNLCDFELYWNTVCYYCGEHITGIGFDQIIAGRGYTKDNVVPCCDLCNYIKWDRSIEDTINHCRKMVAIYELKIGIATKNV